VSYDLAMIDTDKDGLSDWDEINFYKTDPKRADMDGYGLSDGQEVTRYGTDPTRADTDGDGVTDGAEVKQGTDPKDPSSVLPQNLPEIPCWQMRVVSVDSEEVSPDDGGPTMRSTVITARPGSPPCPPRRQSIRTRSTSP
jgi:Bacterial TSP3 repeat